MLDLIFYLILQSIYLILPGIFANSAPVIFKNHLRVLAKPVDFNRNFKGKPLFGSHKTFRGFFVGITSAIIIVYLQFLLFSYPTFQKLSLIDYTNINIPLLGFLIGFGVLFGDLIESFIKRRVSIKPGQSFFPWDQLDSVIGGFIFLLPVYVPSLKVVIIIIVLAVILHVSIRHLAYYLGINKSKW